MYRKYFSFTILTYVLISTTIGTYKLMKEMKHMAAAKTVQVKFMLSEEKAKKFSEIIEREYLTKQGILEKAVDKFITQHEKK